MQVCAYLEIRSLLTIFSSVSVGLPSDPEATLSWLSGYLV